MNTLTSVVFLTLSTVLVGFSAYVAFWFVDAKHTPQPARPITKRIGMWLDDHAAVFWIFIALSALAFPFGP